METDFPGADTFEFSESDAKCYFKKCNALESIRIEATWGSTSRDIYSTLASGWQQMAEVSDGMTIDFKASGCKDLGGETILMNFPQDCAYFASQNHADVYETFAYPWMGGACYYRKCDRLENIKFKPSSDAGTVWTTLLNTGNPWKQLSTSADAVQTSGCEDLGDTRYTMVHECMFDAMIKKADTYEVSGSQCDFKKCGSIGQGKFTNATSQKSIHTLLKGDEVPTIARLQDFVITDGCKDLRTINKYSRPGVSCLQHSYVGGADLFEETDIWCHLKQCGSYSSLKLSAPTMHSRQPGVIHTNLAPWTRISDAQRGLATQCTEVEGFTEQVAVADCKYEAVKAGADLYEVHNGNCTFKQCGILNTASFQWTTAAGDIFSILPIDGGLPVTTSTLSTKTTSTATLHPNATTTTGLPGVRDGESTTTKRRNMIVDHGHRAAYPLAVLVASALLSMMA